VLTHLDREPDAKWQMPSRPGAICKPVKGRCALPLIALSMGGGATFQEEPMISSSNGKTTSKLLFTLKQRRQLMKLLQEAAPHRNHDEALERWIGWRPNLVTTYKA
jgi:hypothetical protein